MEHRFTRQELYDRIWSTPMTRVAAELGTTPSRLSSLIRRAGIPTPASGYWIKKEFGTAETQPPLPPAPADCFEPLVLDTDADTTRARRSETAPRKAGPEAQPLSQFETASAPAAPPSPPHRLRLALLNQRQSLGKLPSHGSASRLGTCPPKAGVKPADAKSEEERVLYCNGLRGLRVGVNSYTKSA